MKLKDIFTPKLLSGLAVVGVVGTAVLAAVEAMSSKDEIKSLKEKIPDEKKSNKLSVSTWYIPRVAGYFKRTIVIGGVTVTCVIASCYLSGLQLAAMAGTITALVTQRDAIEKEVCKIPGGREALERAKKDAAELIAEKKTSQDKKNKLKPWKYQCVEDTGNGDLLCLEGWSGRLFRSSLDAVEQAQSRFNDARDEELPFSKDPDGTTYPTALAVNDLYREYGIEATQLGHDYGWPASDDWYPTRRIEFINTLLKIEQQDEFTKKRYNEDLLVIEIDPNYLPMECWQEY